MTTDPRIAAYVDAIRSASRTQALVSAHDLSVFEERHVADALAFLGTWPAAWTERPLRLIDVGSGNGIPGLVIALQRPAWTVILLDSNNKKALFLESFVNSHSINNVKVLAARAESAGRGSERESFDVATARALGPIATTLELTSSFVRPGGHVIVSRGTSEARSADASKSTQTALGLGEPESVPYAVGDFRFKALIFPKIGITPPLYPRRDGVPAKRPLL